MDSSPDQPPVERMTQLHRRWQWLVLLVFSLLFAGALEIAALPAALLIGPMLAAILAGTNGATVRIPKPLFGSAQAVVGCLVAASISTDFPSSTRSGRYSSASWWRPSRLRACSAG